MSVDEHAGWTPPAANVTAPTSLIFSENQGMVSLDTIRASNIEAGNLEELVAVFGMFLLVATLLRWFDACSCHMSDADLCLMIYSRRYKLCR